MVHWKTRASGRSARPTAVGVSLAALLLLSSTSALALDPSLDVSQYAHTAWRSRDGFPQGIVYAIAQGPDGYLWLGMEFGLFRFDGVRAVPWQPPAGGQLPGDQITSLFLARNGVLWIGTRTGIASLSDGKLTQYPQFTGQHVNALFQDRQGVVWLAAGAPGRICGVKDADVVCEGAGELGQGLVNAAYEDRQGNLWISAADGVWRWKPGPPEQVSLPDGVTQVNDFIEDADGELLVAANGGGLKQLQSGTIRSHPVPGVDARSRPLGFLRSSDGSIWIATLDGLIHVHQGRADWFGVANGLSGEVIQTMYEDREGNIWVTTSGGLDRFRDYAFSTISSTQGLSSSAIFAVQATPDGSIWIATANGLNRWQSGQVTDYRKHDVPPHPLRRNVPMLELNAQALGIDENGRLWATTDALHSFEGEQFVRGLTLPRRASAIAHDGRGNTWVSMKDAGLLRSTAGDSVLVFPWSLFGNEVATTVALLPDPERGIWIGPSSGGLAHFEEGRMLASYTPSDGLARGRVNHLRLGEHGAIWAASEGGLSRIQDGRILTLTSKNGLPCDPVHWSMEDDERTLWLYTACGLLRVAGADLDAWVKMPGRTIQSTLFDGSDGVRITALSSGYSPRVTKAPDGRIWFCTHDGVTVIDPRHFRHNDVLPPVSVEQVTADGRVYDATAARAGPLRLSPGVRDLAIDYTALSLVAPEKVRFRVKLEGQDPDFRELVNERHVRYTNLPPRDYRFLVKAANDSGVWNEAGAFLDFTIPPIFYQATWFRALCVGAAAALLFAAYRFRLAVLERRRRLLIDAQEEERARIAGELHDGVLQHLSAVTLNLGAVKYQIPAGAPAKAEIARAQDQLVEIGRDIRNLSHELHSAMLQETGLVRALSSYCKEFSNARGIAVSYAANLDGATLAPRAALALYRIAQEALGNVAKHAKAKQAQVRLERADGAVRLSVSDDGAGFVPASSGESGGVGLANMRARVRSLDGKFEIESQPGLGTTIRAEVPSAARTSTGVQ